jgi:hypothetical protein
MIVVHDVVWDLLLEVGNFFLVQHKLSVGATGTGNRFMGGMSSHGGSQIVRGGTGEESRGGWLVGVRLRGIWSCL